MAISLKDLATKIDTPITDVLRATREIRGKATIDSNYRVDANEENKIKTFLKLGKDRGPTKKPSDPRKARRFSGQVDKWLGVCNFSGDAKNESNQLRRLAIDVLLTDRKAVVDAERVFLKIEVSTGKEDQFRLGRIKDCLEQWELAAQAFERAGASKEAVKSWRSKPDWSEALRVATAASIVDTDLQWLHRLQATADATPLGLSGRLHENEKKRVNKVRNGTRL